MGEEPSRTQYTCNRPSKCITLQKDPDPGTLAPSGTVLAAPQAFTTL
jgi:hypothetical protein